jgi:ATP-dependent RNA helicase DHX8/PRP22
VRTIGPGGGGNGPGARPGDWTCPKCSANVFASKIECFKCRAPRQAAAFTPGGYGEGDGSIAKVSAAAADNQSGRGKGHAFGGDASKPLIPQLAAREESQWNQLPVLEYRKTIIDMIKANQVIVLTGETGSGKTTQIPQYVAASAGWAGRIGVTQPRRVAAVSVAKRVAEEVAVPIGAEVGYAIRFEDITSPKTAIKFLTDGILLREILSDRLLSNYAFIMLDEAHERSLHTDILFALMKEVVLKRPDFRLMVCSATLDTSKFSDYFFNAPKLDIPGRTFPVEMQYMECNRYVDKVMELVDQLHVQQPVEHHILVFLTGEDEIIRACQGAHRRIVQRQEDGEEVAGLRICPLHSSLPVEFYQRVFDEPPAGTRKLVVATNIAETSITVPGIKFVIDCGAVKQKVFNAESGMESLNVMNISKPAAKQRAGRAGRTGPGVAIRLYSEKKMDKEFPAETVPEILRTNLSSTILTLKSMGIEDPVTFDYMDAPDTDKIVAGLRMLYLLGALDADGGITAVGRDMSLFPLEPALSRMLLAAILHKCADDMVTLVAMVAADGANVFYRPTMKEEQVL